MEGSILIKTPIIVDEHGDTVVYDSVKEAELDLEAIDVANGEYVAYDAEGRLLRLLPAWPHSATIIEEESDPSHQKELQEVLFRYLLQLNIASEWLKQASLDSMIEKAMEFKRR